MKKIVLIEDDAWLAESYARILKREGYRLITTQYPEEAIHLVGPEAPNLIIADVMLEANTVLPLLHELQTYDDTRVIPVILCTALTHHSLQAEKLHTYGVVAVLNKATLTPESMLLAVREACV
jgi:DNA-binding response OmpR family regulator